MGKREILQVSQNEGSMKRSCGSGETIFENDRMRKRVERQDIAPGVLQLQLRRGNKGGVFAWRAREKKQKYYYSTSSA